MGQLGTLNLFVLHAFLHGNQDDRRMARFILKNEVKGALIANLFVFMFYFSRFKTFRNSHLLVSSITASFLGLGFATQGVFPLFSAYHFHKEFLPLSTVQDEHEFKRATQLVNDTLTACYLWDLENAVLLGGNEAHML